MLEQMLKKKCMNTSLTETGCGLQALRWLIDNDVITIVDEVTDEPEVYIDPKGTRVYEVLDHGRIVDDAEIPTAEFGCIACGNCVRIEETDPSFILRAGFEK